MIYIYYSDTYYLPLPKGHKFPMEKYPRVKNNLLNKNIFEHNNFIEPSEIDNSVVELVHHKNYIDKLINGKLSFHEIRRSGFPYNKSMIKREFDIVAGTVEATKKAIDNGIAFNLAGGTHHAFADHAEGFCIFNDIAVSAKYYLKHNPKNQVLIIDLDVHQGNGTASIFKDSKNVFTFSMHSSKCYPLHKESSSLDIPLSNNISDSEYLDILNKNLQKLLPEIKPDIVYFQAGVDILSSDKLGDLNISIDGCKKRDNIVISTLKKLKIPLVITMGGGYSKNIDSIVSAHCNTYKTAKLFFD